MDDRIKGLIVGLTHRLSRNTSEYLNDNLEYQERLKDVMDIVLSSYISALKHILSELSQHDENCQADVDAFFQHLLEVVTLHTCGRPERIGWMN